MSWILRVSLVILELLPVAEAEVGYFAAALETGCLILLLSKSTDKLFQPEMSVLVQQRNIEQGIRLRNKRYIFVGSGCVVFMLAMLLFGREILGLYRAVLCVRRCLCVDHVLSGSGVFAFRGPQRLCHCNDGRRRSHDGGADLGPWTSIRCHGSWHCLLRCAVHRGWCLSVCRNERLL